MDYYNDPILNKIMQEMIAFDRSSVFDGLKSAKIKYQKNSLIGDSRHFIASPILMVMAHNCKTTNKRCYNEQIEAWLSAIINRIPDSLRWKFIYNRFWKWLRKHRIANSGLEDFKLLNEVEEITLGFVAFTDTERTNRELLQQIFEPFIRTVGFSSYDDYFNSCSLLFDLTVRVSEPVLYNELEVSYLEEKWGFYPGALTLTEEKINQLNLKNLDKSFIPIFYGGRKGIRRGLVPHPLAAVNTPIYLSFSIDRAKKEIIDGAFKGPLFEKFLHSVLAGELVLATSPTNKPLPIYVQRADKLSTTVGGEEILKKLSDSLKGINIWEEIGEEWKYHLSQPNFIPSGLIKEYKYFKYHYRVAKNVKETGVIIKRDTHPAFTDFLNNQNQDQWQEDILLIHDKDPKHCLVGAAKFTRKYSHGKYKSGRNHVRELVNYLNNNPKARFELGIPDSYPIVPVLFTSFTGAIHKETNDGVLKTTIFPIMMGTHLKNIKNKLTAKLG